MNIMKTHVQNQVNTANRNLDLVKSTTQYFAQQQLKLASTQVESLISETLLQSPKCACQRLLYCTESKRLSGQLTVSIEMQDGYIHARVSEVTNHE
jgi:exodeoxyribonuclease VII large subunit